MAFAGTDIVAYLAASRPENNSDASGGAIDATMRLIDRTVAFDINGASGDKIDLVSSSASDNSGVTATLEGYAVDGTWISEARTLNGTGHVQSVATFHHLLRIELSANAIGNVTVARYNAAAPVTLFTIPIGEQGAAALFLKIAAEAGGGATVTAYEKCFLKNTNVSFGCVASLFYCATNENERLTFALECAGGTGPTHQLTGGSESAANRLTAPTGGGTYTFAAAATVGAGLTMGDLADGNLSPAEAQGIWVKLTLPAGAAADRESQWVPAWQANGT